MKKIPEKRLRCFQRFWNNATRAIERGVQPKVLRQLLGHASIKITMDRYVHVTDESLTKAVQQFEAAAPIVEKRVCKKGVIKI